MNKRIFIAWFMILIAMNCFAITDQQVITYIKQASAAGKSQQEIGKALLMQGVTPEQAKRIKAQIEAGQGSEENITQIASQGNRLKRQTDDSDDISGGFMDELNRQIDEGRNGQVSGRRIYGHQVFNSGRLTFEPNENLPTPQNYRLGPGDEVIIDIWGNNEDHIRQTISPEGSIMISQIGPVYLNGLNLNEANSHIKSVFSKKYGGMTDEETDIQLTLGQIRSIQVDIMGEVAIPGTYRLSPFSSVFNGIYRAGGINEIGSLRDIQVIRNGKKVAGVDIYEYLFNGKAEGNILLQEGDLIIVPPYTQLVNIDGNVKRPMYYEIKPDETIQDLLDFAGGFTGDAYVNMVRVSRQSGEENELYNIGNENFDSYMLQDGDVVTIGTILDRYSNRVEIKGSVYRPGMYAISPSMRTVGQLLSTANGLTDDAYTGRALLYREGPELQLEILSLDLDNILAKREPDIELKRNDILVINSINELNSRGSLRIFGQIINPGEYPFAENMTVEDLILAAGGLREGASLVKVDIARRIDDPTAIEQTNQLAKIFTVSIDETLKKGTGEDFKLEPYDYVYVRRSPGYSAQSQVFIDGEILFSGAYVLERRNERISELINRAGGVLDGAYVKGAYLERSLTESEYLARQETLRFAIQQSQSTTDSVSLSKLEVSKMYNVGIDLEMALANPGSHYDVILQPGDHLFIPQLQSTVKISGDVMFPNSVVYEPGKKLSYYINQAGGYGERAKKRNAFIVYMNGNVTKAKRNSIIEPGCNIIVPSKSANSGVNWTQVMALATSFTSVASLAATIVSLIK